MDRARVIKVYFLLAGLYTLAASLIWGVNTLFLLDAGLSIGQVFVANAVFSAGMVIFEIPTGVVADTLGRRVSYLFSVGVLAVTTIAYLLVWNAQGGVVAFSVVSIFVGLGFTFYSGALEAWMVDALKATGGDSGLDHVFARAQQVMGAAMIAGTVGGGLLGQLNLGLPFLLRGILLVVLLVIAGPLMVEQGFTPRALTPREFPREMLLQAKAGIDHGWNRPGLRPLILTSAVTSGFLYWGFYAAQPYLLLLLERDAVWVVGVITAGLSLATMMGNQVAHVLSGRCRRRSTLLLGAAIATSAAAVVMGMTESFAVAVIAFLALGAAMGVAEPMHRAYLHTVTASEVRATVASFDAMVGSTGGVVGQVGLGAVSDARSLSFGYVTGGLATLLALPLLWTVRRVGGPGDQIVGPPDAGGACAPEGLPSIAQISDDVPAPAAGH